MKADPLFDDPQTESAWQAWLGDLRRHRTARVRNWGELENELALHVRDDVLHAEDGTETERLQLALARLGEPQDVASAWREEEGEDAPRPIERVQAEGGAATGRLLQALALSLGVLLVIVGGAALVDPDVGLWLHADGSFSISFNEQPGSLQWGRGWLGPVALVVGLAILALGLRPRG